MKKNTSTVIIIIINAAAIFWLIWLSTFNVAIKYIQAGTDSSGEYKITPYGHLVFPIFALLLSSFFFIRNIFSRRSADIPGNSYQSDRDP